jgi:hypothetical protein
MLIPMTGGTEDIMSHMKPTLPRLILAAMVLVLVVGAIPAQAAKPNLAPAISLGPLSHREELSATISAKAKLTRVELRVDKKKVQPWVKGRAGWKYSIKYPLKKLAVGMHTAKLKVWDQKNRSSQHQWRFQKLAALALSAEKSSVQPGERVILTGQGFTPGTAITVGMGGSNTGVGGNYGSATADGSGRFTVEVTLAQYPDSSPLHAGTITLLAHNKDGSEKAGVELQVLPAPKLSLDKSSIKPGDQVRVTGEGFTPGVAISISLGSVNTGASGNYGSAVTDNTGGLAVNVTLAQFPDGSPLYAGPVVLVAHTADSQEKATAQLQIRADPSITLSKTAIKAGEKITVSGKGFTPGTPASIALGGVNTGASGNYGSAVADSSGRFSLEVTLARYPDGSPLKPGAIVLLAHTPDFGEKAAFQLQVQANPVLAASKSLIRVGESVTLNGEGFTPSKTVTIGLVGVNMDHGDRYGTVGVDTNGRFSFQLSLARYPDGTPLPPGGITLRAFTVDGEQALVDLRLLATPAISLDKTVIMPGDQVRVTGQGFSPGALISISMGPVNSGTGGNYGSAVVDANGRFSVPVTLARYPDGSPLSTGAIVLLAHPADFGEKASAQLQVLATPAIALDKTSIQPGDRVLVTGQGFTPGVSVSISLGGVNTGASGNYGTAVANVNGRFSLAVILERYPNGSPLQAGPILLVAHNASWEQTASARLQVVTLSAAPMSVQPGEPITLTGQGFRRGSAIILSVALYGAAPAGNYGSAVVDATGRFVLTTRLIHYPDGAPLQAGSLVLVVHDGAWSQRAAIQIQVVDRSPSAPGDLRIISLTKGATSAESTVVGLQWRDNSPNETGFSIRATFTRMNGGTDTQVWNVAASATTAQVSFVAGGINPVTKVCFTVTAFNSQGDSAPSNQVCAVL